MTEYATRGLAANRAIWGNSPCRLTPWMTIRELQEHEAKSIHDPSCPFFLPVVQRAPEWWPVA